MTMTKGDNGGDNSRYNSSDNDKDSSVVVNSELFCR